MQRSYPSSLSAGSPAGPDAMPPTHNNLGTGAILFTGCVARVPAAKGKTAAILRIRLSMHPRPIELRASLAAFVGEKPAWEVSAQTVLVKRITRTMSVHQSQLPFIKREDSWAIIIALGLTFLITATYLLGGFGLLKSMAVSIPTWSNDMTKVTAALSNNATGIVTLFAFFLVAFTVGAKVMGRNVGQYLGGFTVLFIVSLVVTILGSNKYMKDFQLETPLLALLLGMLVSNTVKLPAWFQEALRTEYYVKTGIVLMGATLPFTIIMSAGPMAMLQATIVAVVTFFSIYLAAVHLFKLDPRFAATLGAGGSICGVSGAIAVGGACRAKKEHISIAISLVVVWAVVMVASLPAAALKIGMPPGPAGAWIGTSEFADAAGFAAAEQYTALAHLPPGDDQAVKTFTLMKVVGRDMFVGLWALLAAVLSITLWEKKSLAQAERVDYGEVWRRFPKFVLGFFVASIFATIVIMMMDAKTGSGYSKEALAVVKNLRGWTFTWAFLAIGLTTRFRELLHFGWKPLAAFTVGVAINVPLGYWLSHCVFVSYWLSVK